ncbi:MAG: ACT domain-containing protein [Candidatus Woesearchaeota archaeon]
MGVDHFNGGKVLVWKGVFSVFKSQRPYPNAFANVVDRNETTVIIEQGKFYEGDVIEMSDGWKVLTFDMVIPLDTVGFTGRLGAAMAEANISFLMIGAFSTDHILVKEKDLERAKQKLRAMGCVFER